MRSTGAFFPQTLLRRVILFGTPLLLGILELTHPLLDHKHTIVMLAPIANWWIVLHLLLIPLFALMGQALYLLLDGINNKAAILSRYATVVYIAFTIGYDTAVGLSTGILVSNVLVFPPSQQAVLQEAITQIFSSPAIILSSFIVIISGVVAICSAAWSLRQAGVPWIPVVVLVGATASAYSHALPFGTFGSTCFLLAALWIELVWRQRDQDEMSRKTVASIVHAL